MTIEQIITQIVFPVVSVIGSVLIGFIKNKNVKKYANAIINLTEQAKIYIVEAEQFKNYSGKEKKSYVMSRLFKYVFDNSIKKVNESLLSDIVENEVELTNNVNIEKKNIQSQETLTNSTTNLSENLQPLNS